MLNVNSWVEVSASALESNIAQFRKILSPKTKLAAVVKSNAYGHGLLIVAQAIANFIDYFCTVNLEEALILRKQKLKKPILVLSFYFDNIEQALKNNIELVVYRPDQIDEISRVAKKLHKKAKLHLKVETGVGRLGVNNKAALFLAKKISQDKYLELTGVFSHFAASEENQSYTNRQLQLFNQFLKNLNQLNLEPRVIHFASSAASLVRFDAHFDMIRLGIGLYGLWPSNLTERITCKKYPNFNLKPVLTWKTKIILIKDVPANSNIGYGCTHTINRKTKIAVLPIGYFDGYDRLFSRKSQVVIQGQKCKVLGRVAMNLTVVDISRLKNVKLNTEVELLGSKVSANDLAEIANTINYEIVTRINPNLPRILVA